MSEVDYSPKIKTSKGGEINSLAAVNGYLTCTRDLNLKNTVGNDQYFQHMDQFIDDKLDLVATLLKEKKVLADLNK